LPKTTFRTKIDGGLGQGAVRKFWNPLLISTTADGSNFKFGVQLGLREYPTTTFTTKNGVGVG